MKSVLYLELRLEGGAKVKSVLLFLELRLEEGIKVTFIPLYLYLRLLGCKKVCRTIVCMFFVFVF